MSHSTFSQKFSFITFLLNVPSKRLTSDTFLGKTKFKNYYRYFFTEVFSMNPVKKSVLAGARPINMVKPWQEPLKKKNVG